MTHLPFIIPSYLLAVAVPVAFAWTAALRLSRARRRLLALGATR